MNYVEDQTYYAGIRQGEMLSDLYWYMHQIMLLQISLAAGLLWNIPHPIQPIHKMFPLTVHMPVDFPIFSQINNLLFPLSEIW